MPGLIAIIVSVALMTISLICKLMIQKGITKLTELIRYEQRSNMLRALHHASWWYSEDPITLTAIHAFIEQIGKDGFAYSDQHDPREIWRKKLLESEHRRSIASELGQFWRPVSCKPLELGVYVCLLSDGSVANVTYNDRGWVTPNNVATDVMIDHWIDNPIYTPEDLKK